MKKIAFALVALLVALSPLAAGESWIGVTTGPAFEIQVTDEIKEMATSTTVTDFNWDINLEGAYYFDEAETIGIGARLGVGIYYGSTFEIKDEMIQKLAMGAIGSDALAAILQQAQMTPDAFMASVLDSVEYKSITGGTKIAPAITFQYRLALADNLDLRLGAGLQYIHTEGKCRHSCSWNQGVRACKDLDGQPRGHRQRRCRLLLRKLPGLRRHRSRRHSHVLPDDRSEWCEAWRVPPDDRSEWCEAWRVPHGRLPDVHHPARRRLLRFLKTRALRIRPIEDMP